MELYEEGKKETIRFLFRRRLLSKVDDRVGSENDNAIERHEKDKGSRRCDEGEVSGDGCSFCVITKIPE